MTKNAHLLNNWLFATLADNPTIIKESKTHIEVYQQLYELWLIDCQSQLKKIAIETRGNKK